MISLFPVLIVVALAVGLAVAARTARTARAGPTPELADDRLGAWVAAGLLTDAQAAAIRAHEAATSPAAAIPARAPQPVPAGPRPARRVPAVAEALGYIGGVLAAAGLALLLAQAWDTLGTGGRLGVSAAGAAVVTAAGLAVRPRPGDAALARLRAFLWLLGSATTGVLAGVAVVDAAGIEGGSTRLTLVASAVALHAGALWWRDAHAALQQATCLGAVLAAVAGVGGESGRGDVIGAAMAPAAVGLLVAGLARRTTAPTLTAAIGAFGTALATFFVTDEWEGPGFVLAVAVAATLVGLALVRRTDAATTGRPAPERLAAGAVGLGALTLVVGPTLGWYAREAGVATGLVVAAVGLGLVVAAARHAVRVPHLVEAAGALVVVGGLALTAVQSVGTATLVGLAGAVGLVAVGTLPERSVLSIVGALGLLVNVPWSIAWFFPGEGRTPALVMVTGASIVGVAVLLARQSGRLRHELGGHRHHGPGLV